MCCEALHHSHQTYHHHHQLSDEGMTSEFLVVGGGDGSVSLWERMMDYRSDKPYFIQTMLCPPVGPLTGKVSSVSLLPMYDPEGRMPVVHTEMLAGTSGGTSLSQLRMSACPIFRTRLAHLTHPPLFYHRLHQPNKHL